MLRFTGCLFDCKQDDSSIFHIKYNGNFKRTTCYIECSWRILSICIDFFSFRIFSIYCAKHCEFDWMGQLTLPLWPKMMSSPFQILNCSLTVSFHNRSAFPLVHPFRNLQIPQPEMYHLLWIFFKWAFTCLVDGDMAG